MQDVEDFRALIALWPTPHAFAADVAGACYGPCGRVWKRRNRVPLQLHRHVVSACARRGLAGIDMEKLDAMWRRGGGR